MTVGSLLPENEAERIDAVRRYDVLDSPPDGAFDRITALAARLFDVPISIVSIVDTDRIWFKSHHGLAVPEIDRKPGLCASAILGDDPWVVTDASTDPRALANPLVAGDFGLRFYAGVPLRTHDGFNLGTLCVISREARGTTESEMAMLADLAAVVMDELELRMAARRTVGLESELRRRAETVASTLQQSLLPPTLPEVEHLDLVSRYHVAQADVVGGDFFDVVPAAWGTALVVGDACGKGTMAAGLAGTARWTLHSVMTDQRDPAAALERLDTVLRRSEAGRERYVTIVAASLCWSDDHFALDVGLGGHPHPLVVRADGSVEALGTTGPIVGWAAGGKWTNAPGVLRTGDALVLFTDGLLETLGGRGETDDTCLRNVLAPTGGRSATEIADALDAAIADALDAASSDALDAASSDGTAAPGLPGQSGQSGQSDDAAFLVARVR